jgi:hypothetical protein
MSRAQLTALMTALPVGAFAPRLAAQDTSTTRETRPDTSGYNGTAGIDTTAQPGRVGALDSSGVGLDSMRSGADSMALPGGTDRTSPTDSGSSSASDSASVSQPTKQPGQSTSRTGDSASSTSP